MTSMYEETLERRLHDANERAEAATARAEKAEAEAAVLTARVAQIDAGISIRGWWCAAGICQGWNGEEHSKRDVCRVCGVAKTVRT